MAATSTRWKICCGAVIAVSVVAFSPVVLSSGEHEPELFGLPRTLWLGIAIAFALVFLTWFGGSVHPDNNQDQDSSRDNKC